MRSLPWSSSRAQLALSICMVAGVLSAQASDKSGTVQDAGVLMRWRYEASVQGSAQGLGRLTMELSDRASGTPLRYQPGQLAAWLQRQRPTLSEGELPCIDRVKSLVSTGVGRRADIDLNTYRILTLNTDRTVAFINPFVALNNAKLESIVTLPGTPRAWVHAPARAELWVMVDGKPGQLVVVDTYRRQIARSIELPANDADATLALDESNAYAWVAFPFMGRVATLSLNGRTAVWQSAPMPGVRAMHVVVTPDGPMWLSAQADGRLVRWTQGVNGPKPGRTWTLPHPLRGVVYSGLARRIVAHDEQALLSIDPDGTDVRRLALGHPVTDLLIADEGRYAVALGGGRLSMVDLASGAIHARGATLPDARQLVLTGRFVYAIGGDEAAAQLWALADLRAGRVQPAQVLLGSAGSPKDAPAGLRRAIVSPGGSGMLVANSADRLIYQYTEGMMAPVGSFANYKRVPLAIGLLDLGPREIAPGRYAVPVRYDTGGPHHLVVSGAGPRFVGCDRVVLTPTVGQAEREAMPEPRARLVEDRPLLGDRRRVVVAMTEQSATGAGRPLGRVRDLTLVMFDKRSGWQQRARLHELEDVAGRYAAEVHVPHGLSYEMFVGSVSRDLPYLSGRVSTAPEARP